MPDRLDLVDHEDRTERLSRAIDRLLDGGPAPVFDDPDLQDLLSLAGRLHDELPRDLPDPAFRARLKAELTDELPAIVPLQPSASPSVTPRRFPYMAALAGVAALLLAVAGVSSLALWSRSETPDGGNQQALDAGFTATSPFTASALGLATATVPDIAGLGIETPDTTLTAVPQATADNAGRTPPLAEERVDPTDQVVPRGATEGVDSGLAALPDVDGSTVEDGPVPLASGDGHAPTSGVRFVLATELPSVDTESTVYALSPPSVDPVTLVEKVGGALGIVGAVQVNDATGEAEYSVDGDDGSTFRWYPSSGEFSYASAAEPVASDMTADEASANAREWLIALGYPVERLKGEFAAQPIDESQWLVETWVDSMPQPGVGHQLGARIYVGGDGSILGATGYWLEVVGVTEVSLLTAQEAWVAAKSGEGYWTGDGAADSGGELRCRSIELAYLLTDAGEGRLVLQPVFRIDGLLRDSAGAETPISIFVKAARPDGENTP